MRPVRHSVEHHRRYRAVCPTSWKPITPRCAALRVCRAGYELRYLGDLLNNGQQPKLVGQSLPLPVILVRSKRSTRWRCRSTPGRFPRDRGEEPRPQFAGVHGISGATILGDGRVVVILDLLATIRVLRICLPSCSPWSAQAISQRRRD